MKSISLMSLIAGLYLLLKALSAAFKTFILLILNVFVFAFFHFNMFHLGHDTKSFDFVAIKHLFWAIVLYMVLSFIIRLLMMALNHTAQHMNAIIAAITFVISFPIIVVASFGALRYALIVNNVDYTNNICIVVALLVLEILRKNSAVKIKTKGAF